MVARGQIQVLMYEKHITDATVFLALGFDSD